MFKLHFLTHISAVLLSDTINTTQLITPLSELDLNIGRDRMGCAALVYKLCFQENFTRLRWALCLSAQTHTGPFKDISAEQTSHRLRRYGSAVGPNTTKHCSGSDRSDPANKEQQRTFKFSQYEQKCIIQTWS